MLVGGLPLQTTRTAYEELIDPQRKSLLCGGHAHLLHQIWVERAYICDWTVEDGRVANQEAINALRLDQSWDTDRCVLHQAILSNLDALRDPLLQHWISNAAPSRQLPAIERNYVVVSY